MVRLLFYCFEKGKYLFLVVWAWAWVGAFVDDDFFFFSHGGGREGALL